jgi:hypothetical protein
VGQPVEKPKRREFDDAVNARPRGRSPAPRADPVCRLVPWQHIADFGDAAVCTTPDGEPLHAEPPHVTTAHLFGERGQIGLSPSRGEPAQYRAAALL